MSDKQPGIESSNIGSTEAGAKRIAVEKQAKEAIQKSANVLRALRGKEKSHEEKKETPDYYEGDVIVPYAVGSNEFHVSPKGTFKPQVEQIYSQEETIYTTYNLREYFGSNYQRFIIDRDPVSDEKPITFLGKPIRGGINLMTLPFLKIAERNLMNQGLSYIPTQEQVTGFRDENMCIGDGKGGLMLDPNIPSFHKYGLAVDLDPYGNWPKDGRGDIPDEVVLAMAEAGFNIGMMGDKTASHYLINDLMHFQMRFPPDSPAGQKIIEASPIGKRYWNAVQPLLEQVRPAA